MQEPVAWTEVDSLSRLHADDDEVPPKLFECKLCGKIFDSDEDAPTCPECDSSDVEQVG
jgi:rubrerythrin